MSEREFITSVADVYAYDPRTGSLLFRGKSNLSSMIDIAMSNTEVRGGKNHQLLFDYNFGRTMNFEISSAAFEYAFFATNIGKSIQSAAAEVLQEECVTLSVTGEGTLSSTPATGTKVNVIKGDGAVQEITPVGSTVIYLPWAEEDVTVVYFANKTADVLEIDATSNPSVVKLVMVADRFNNSGRSGIINITIPKAQISGNFSLEFASDSVLSTQLNGKALVESAGCGSDIYGTVAIEPVSGSEVPVSQISPYFEDNGSDYLEAPAGAGTYQILVDGFRGGLYGKTDVTSDCTFTKVAGDADITVGLTGLVTVASGGTAADTAQIKVEYDGAADQYVNITLV